MQNEFICFKSSCHQSCPFHMRFSIDFMYLRHSSSFMIHHFSKAHRAMTVGWSLMTVGNMPEHSSGDCILWVIPVLPTLSVVHFTIWIWQPFLVAWYLIFLLSTVRNVQGFLQTLHIPLLAVWTPIQFLPAIKIVIFAVWQVVKLFETFCIFFTIFARKCQCLSPTIFIILLTRFLVDFRYTFEAFLFVTSPLHKGILDPTIPIIPFTCWQPSFSFPTLNIVIFARIIEIIFQTLNILTWCISVVLNPTIVIIFIAILWISHCYSPTFDIIVFTMRVTIPLLPACSILLTMRVEKVR